MNKILISLILTAFFAVSCQKEDNKTATQDSRQQTNKTRQDSSRENTSQTKTGGLQITSTAFINEGMIPKKYACNGDNVSPPLSWSGIPAGTKSLALIVLDPDAPSGDFVHWVMYNIPPDVKELKEDTPKDKKLSNGAMQGLNGDNKTGFSGPCPPSGTHRYFFNLYALDIIPDVSGDVTKDKLLGAIKGHVLTMSQLMGKYSK